MSAPSSNAGVFEDFWRLFSRHAEGGNIMKYAYLAPGDRFGAIVQNPEYYVTNDELRTLDEQTPWLASLLSATQRQPGVEDQDGPSVAIQTHVVEWGPGPSHIVQQKTLPLMKALAGGPCPPRYEAVDISEAYAHEAAGAIADGLASTGVSAPVHAAVTDFMAHAAAQASSGNDEQRTCMLFWGVTFGNFQGAEREHLIAGMKSYDSACFTVDHNLDVPSLLAAYDTTPSKNFVLGALEYFQTIVEEDTLLSVSGFDLSAWEVEHCCETEHLDASGVVDELRVVGYVRSRRAQTMVFAGLGLDQEVVQIAAGERFQVFESRKYSEGRVRELVDCVPSEQPKRVVASGVFGKGSRVGLVVVSAVTSNASKDAEEVESDMAPETRFVICGA